MALRSDRDALGAYMGTLSTVEVLSREDERALALRYRAGDARAGAELVRGCLPFVTSIALEYRKWGVPLEDIIQEGNVGLLKAAARFDPSRDCRLATYAGYWIRAEIREFVVRAFRVVRVGTTKGERRGLRALRRGEIADVAAMAERSAMSVERAALFMAVAGARESSLDAPWGERGTLGEAIELAEPTPEERLADREATTQRQARVEGALAVLDARERQIVDARILSDDPPTLAVLGQRFGVSKERVRQVEARALRKLRDALEPEVELAMSG